MGALIAQWFGTAQAEDSTPGWRCHADDTTGGWNCNHQTPAVHDVPPGFKPDAESGEDALLITERRVIRTQAKIIEDLGWIYTGNCDISLCGGYYKALILPTLPAGMDPDDIPIRIAADDSSFSQSGLSQLQGDVIISRADSLLEADTVYLDRDPETKKFSVANAYGNVRLQQPGFLAIASHAQTDLQKNTGYLENVLYRMPRLSKYSKLQVSSTPIPQSLDQPEFVKIYGTTGWGQANSVVQQENGIIVLQNATYTTCTPDTSEWVLSAKRLNLDNKEGIGVARHATLKYKGFPIFYTPYYRFPLNDDRRSGLLLPHIGYSNDSGYEVGVPFYWNIAPNYDATITPYYYSERGVQLNGLFRWLTEKMQGNFFGGIIPHDEEFASFQNNAQTEYAGNPNLPDLENATTTRGFFTLQNIYHFNEHWQSSVDYSYVSDDYYLEDFGLTPQTADDNQLLRQGDVSYRDDNLYFLTRLQGYQTLQPVDQPGVETQYERLPQVDLNLAYPDALPYGLTFNQNNQFVYFDHDNDINEDTGQDFVTGSRINAQPSIALPIIRPMGFITPQAQFKSTFYHLDNPGNDYDVVNDIAIPNASSNPNDPSINLPVFSLDSGLYFDRDMQWFGKKFQQTLEPRMMYLYVPYEDQQDIPLFDTTLPLFTYDSLWRTNRFTGTDRLGDANQMSMGVTSRFIDPLSGEERLRGSIGQTLYFEDREVTLCGTHGCAGTDNLLGEANQSALDSPVSPLASEMIYQINDDWNFRSNAAYTVDDGEFNNAYTGFQYRPDERHILNLGYRFIRGGDVDEVNSGPAPANDSSVNDYNRPDVSAFWGLTDQWSIMGRYSYNISHGYDQAYFYGVQYNNCCWSVRLLQSRYEDGIDGDNNTQYSQDIYLEFSLHGLGALGSGKPGALLEESIPGYNDRFGQPM